MIQKKYRFYEVIQKHWQLNERLGSEHKLDKANKRKQE